MSVIPLLIRSDTMLSKCKYICIFFVLIRFSNCDRSFTIVLDTTRSMQVEIDVLKANLGTFLYSLNRTDIANYILVPFDEGLPQPVVSQTPIDIQAWMNTVSISDRRRDCPENSLAGIEKALQISKPHSNIFVFTDAYSKDAGKLNNVKTLCQSTNSQVVIFLSGYCSQSSSVSDVEVYYNIATACSGAVVRFEDSTLRQAFNVMKEVIKVDWTEVRSYDQFSDYKQFTFPVYSYTTDILVIVSGELPVVDITNSYGSRYRAEKIVDTSNSQVLRFGVSTVDEYTVSIRCRNQTSATLYIRHDLPIRIGFSTKSPRSIKETSAKPIPGRVNYMLFTVLDTKLKIKSIEIQVGEGDEKIMDLEEKTSAGLYLAKSFVEPDKHFRFRIKLISNSNNEIKSLTKYLWPQKAVSDTKWMKPKAEIIETEPVMVMWRSNATLACKVDGYPKPNIWWEDEGGKTLPSEYFLLEISSIYISYVTLESFNLNTTVYCKSENSEGQDSEHIKVFVNRPFTFEVKRTPKDLTIEYGNDGKLPCDVDTYPAAELNWYHNDKRITSIGNPNLNIEEDGLLIRNMSPNNVGKYECKVDNGIEKRIFTANVKISGIEAPEIHNDKSEMVLNLGDWMNLECRIRKGKPTPSVTWKYKSDTDSDFGALPSGVMSNDGKLKISSVQKIHRGVYRCEAVNIQGQDSAQIILKVTYAPIITNSTDNELIVREDDFIELPCEVDASPVAEVRWELSQDDLLIALNSRHTTDEHHTLRFTALWKDSGEYHCIAENKVGKADKTVTVNVLVPPYIQPPKPSNLTVRTGATVVLDCRVTFGNPPPSTKWEFVALDSTTRVLSRSNSSHPLRLTNATRANEGQYLCIAENEVSIDSIKYFLRVQ